VVIAIIGILVGAVVMSVSVVGSDREAEQEVRRLQGLIDLLHEDSLMQSRDYGLMLTTGGYRFYAYDYKQLKWLEVAGDKLLAEHAVRTQLVLALALDGKDVQLQKKFETLDREKDPEPQVMILSSGEITPFVLDVSREGVRGHFSLTGDLDGKLAVARLHVARGDGGARDRRARHDGRERSAEPLRGRRELRRGEDAR
jgi:general secretion pathway protein H